MLKSYGSWTIAIESFTPDLKAIGIGLIFSAHSIKFGLALWFGELVIRKKRR